MKVVDERDHRTIAVDVFALLTAMSVGGGGEGQATDRRHFQVSSRAGHYVCSISCCIAIIAIPLLYKYIGFTPIYELAFK
jgi:hypothetical protein